MEVVRSSVLCTWLMPLWRWLRERYEYSLLAKILRGIARGWSAAYHGSALMGFLSREGVLSRAWPDDVSAEYPDDFAAKALCRGAGRV